MPLQYGPSAQVVITEIDLSQLAAEAFGHSYLLMGEASKGRDDKPIKTTNKASFVRLFGAQAPDYPSIYSAMEYLSFGNQLNMKRVTSTKFIKFLTDTEIHLNQNAEMLDTADTSGEITDTPMLYIKNSTFRIASSWRDGQTYPFHLFMRTVPNVIMIYDRNGNLPMVKAYIKSVFYYYDSTDVAQPYKGITDGAYEYYGFNIEWDSYGQDYSLLTTANAMDWTNCDVYIGHAEPAYNSHTRFLNSDAEPAQVTLSFSDRLEKTKWVDAAPATNMDSELHYVTYYEEDTSSMDLYAPVETDIYTVLSDGTSSFAGATGYYVYYRWSMSNDSFETNLSRPILVSIPNALNKVVFNFPALRKGFTKYNLYRTETIDASSDPTVLYDTANEVYKTYTTFIGITSQSFSDTIATGSLVTIPSTSATQHLTVEIDGTVLALAYEKYAHYVTLDADGDVIGEYIKDVFTLHKDGDLTQCIGWCRGNSDDLELGMTLYEVIKVFATDVDPNNMNTGVLTIGDGVRTEVSVTGQMFMSDWIMNPSDTDKYMLWRYTGDSSTYSYSAFQAIDEDPDGNEFTISLNKTAGEIGFTEYPTLAAAATDHYSAKYSIVTTDYGESAANPTASVIDIVEEVANTPTATLLSKTGACTIATYHCYVTWVGDDGSECSASLVDDAACAGADLAFTVEPGAVPTTWTPTGWYIYIDREVAGPTHTYYKVGTVNGTTGAIQPIPLATTIMTFDADTDYTPFKTLTLGLPIYRSFLIKANFPKVPEGLRGVQGAKIYMEDVDGTTTYVNYSPAWHHVYDVVAATTANIALTGAITVDGQACLTGQRVLVKDQTDPTQNGIYLANTGGAWTRASDSNAAAEVKGAYIYVQYGTTQGGTYWFNSNTGTVTVTTTALTYELVNDTGYQGPETLFTVSKTAATEVTPIVKHTLFDSGTAVTTAKSRAVDYIKLYATIFGTDYYMYNENDFDRYSTICKGRGTWANGMPVYTTYNELTQEYECLVYDPLNGSLLERWTNATKADLIATVTEYSNFIKFVDLTDWTYTTTVVPFGVSLVGRQSQIPYYEAILNYGYDGAFDVDESDFIANLDPGVAAAKYNMDASFIDLVNTSQMVYEFDGVFDYEILSIPGWSTHVTLANSMIAACEHRKFSACITDMPMGLNPQQAVDYRTTPGTLSLSNLDSSYCALYWNWGKVYDAVNDVYVWLPPTTFAIRALAVTDRSNVPWAAAAGLRRGLVPEVLELEFNPTLGDRDDLYRVQINPIARIGTTIAVWGDATTQKMRSMLSAFHVRRILVSAEKATYLTSLYSLFEPNDQIERDRLINTLLPIFDSIKQQRGLIEFGIFDATTDQDVAYNTARFRIELKPVPAMEIILHEFVIKNPMQKISAPGQGI